VWVVTEQDVSPAGCRTQDTGDTLDDLAVGDGSGACEDEATRPEPKQRRGAAQDEETVAVAQGWLHARTTDDEAAEAAADGEGGEGEEQRAEERYAEQPAGRPTPPAPLPEGKGEILAGVGWVRTPPSLQGGGPGG